MVGVLYYSKSYTSMVPVDRGEVFYSLQRGTVVSSGYSIHNKSGMEGSLCVCYLYITLQFDTVSFI